MHLRLILPHIVGSVLIVIVWVSSPAEVYAYIPVLHETLELSIPVEYNIPVKIVLTVVTLIVVLLIHLRRDYGKFIPNHWDMKVFFDKEGLESVVKSFTDEERRNLRIPNDWQNYSVKFINHLNQQLKRYDESKIAKFGENTLGFGNFTYKYHKVPGQQKYHVDADDGYVEFNFSSQEEKISILAMFKQLPRAADYVEPSITDILYNFNTIVAPTFRLIISMDDLRHREIAAITCPTRIRFLPTIDVSRTLYMTDIRATIKSTPKDMPEPMIPYAYAVNQVQRH